MRVRILAFILFNVFIYIGLHFYAKHKYIYKLTHYHNSDKRFKGYDKYLNLQLPKKLKKELGFTFYNTENSYEKYIAKPKDKPRIGILGNSLTWGSEINPNLAYTNLLNQTGLKYDFISLAAPSFGFFRSERLLKYYKEELSLDKIILGPFLLEPNKDLTFDMMFGSIAGGYSHGRYIYDHELKYISPTLIATSNRFENIKEKVKLIPDINEILYDYHGPYNFHLISKLFNNNYINPFYDYRDQSVFNEYKYITQKLIKRLTKNYEVISLELDENINQNLSSSFPKLTRIIKLEIPQKIPYWKLRHPSELGHQAISEIIKLRLENKMKQIKYLKVCTNNINIDKFQNSIGLNSNSKKIGFLNKDKRINSQDTMIVLTENNDFINSSIITITKALPSVEVFLDDKKQNIVEKIGKNIYLINFPSSRLVKGIFPINRYFYFPNTSDIKIKANNEILYHGAKNKVNYIKNLNYIRLNKIDDSHSIRNQASYKLHLPKKLTITGNFKYDCN